MKRRPARLKVMAFITHAASWENQHQRFGEIVMKVTRPSFMRQVFVITSPNIDPIDSDKFLVISSPGLHKAIRHWVQSGHINTHGVDVVDMGPVAPTITRPYENPEKSFKKAQEMWFTSKRKIKLLKKRT